MTTATIRRPGDGEPNRAFALPRTFLLTAADTDGAFSLWRETVPPGAGPPLHRHVGQRELFQVASGRLLFACEDERVELTAGAVILIPPGARHAFVNVGDEAAEIVVTTTPGGAEGFFREVEQAGLEPPGDMAKIVEIAARYGLEFTGPPLHP